MLDLLERATGFEPATYSLGSCHSTTELRPHHERSRSLNCNALALLHYTTHGCAASTLQRYYSSLRMTAPSPAELTKRAYLDR